VPKPFFRVKYPETSSKSTELDMQIKRLLKFEFSHVRLRKIQKILASVQQQIDTKKSNGKLKRSVPIGKKFNVIKWIKSFFGEVGLVNFSTSQILLKLAAYRRYNFKTHLSSI
jgi:hypothetical protein